MIDQKDGSQENSVYAMYAISTFFSLLAVAIYWYFILDVDFASLYYRLPFTSVMFYVVSIIIFIFVFVVLWLIINKIPLRFRIINSQRKIICRVLFGVVIFVLCIMLYFLFVNELLIHPGASLKSYLFYHTIPVPIVAFLLISLFMFFVYMTKIHKPTLNKTKNNKAYFILCIAVAMAVGYQAYSPNVFTNFMDYVHVHAYYASAYNATYGAPFSMEMTSSYGHYGIIYSIPMRIFKALGGTDLMLFFNILISLGSIAVVFLVAYTLHVMIKNNTIKCLSVICALCINLCLSRYWQLWPHRQIPIAVMAAFIAFYIKHKNMKLFIIAGLPLSSLFLVWSTDYGLVAALAWVSFFAMHSLQKYPVRSIRLWLNLLCSAGLLVLSFIFAVGFVGIFNLLHGGGIIGFRTFLLFTVSSEFVNNLIMMPPKLLTAWMPVLAMSLCFVGRAIINIRLFNKNPIDNPIYPAYFSYAVLALGGMVYYMNRASWSHHGGAYMIYFVMVAILAQHWLPYVKQFFSGKSKNITVLCGTNAAMGICSIFILFAVAAGSVTNYSFALAFQNENRDINARNEVVMNTANAFPRILQGDVPAWGLGVVELYSILGLDTQIYTFDSTSLWTREAMSITQESLDYLHKTILENEGRPFLTSDVSMFSLDERKPGFLTWLYDNYYLSGSVLVHEILWFLYFEPIDSGD